MAHITEIKEYPVKYVDKIISTLLVNEEVLNSIGMDVDPEYFDNPYHKWIIRHIVTYFQRYESNPTRDYFRNELKKENDASLREGCRILLNQLYEIDVKNWEEIRDEFGDFCRHKAFKNATLRAVQLVEVGKYEEASKIMQAAMDVGKRLSIGHLYNQNIEERYIDETEKIIPLPFDEYNQRMDVGGLTPGKLVYILGPGGGGKTWFIINWMNKLLVQGFNVLHFNLESKFTKVGARYDANLLQMNSKECRYNQELIKQEVQRLPGQLIVKDLKGDDRTLNYMKNYVRFLRRKTNFVPDVIVIDYIKRMKTGTRNSNQYINESDLIKEIIDFANDCQVPIISPAPLNRAGANVSVVKEEHVAGTFDLIYDADLILSLSRKSVMHWIKNKDGQGLMSDQLSIDFSTGQFHIIGEFDEKEDEKQSKY